MVKTKINNILQISEDGHTLERCSNGNLANVVIPEGVTVIKQRAFEGANISSVSFPSSLFCIEEAAFRGNTNLITLDFSKTKLWCVCENAFAWCFHVKSIIFPETISLIESCAFFYCQDLLKIESLPDKKIDIAGNAFNGCNLMNFNHPSLQIKDGLVIQNNSIIGCTYSDSCLSLTIPEGVDTIQKSALKLCVNDLQIGEGIKTILPDSIECEGLLILRLPSSLEHISKKFFRGYVPFLIEDYSTRKRHLKDCKIVKHSEKCKYSVIGEDFVVRIENNRTTLVRAVPNEYGYPINIPDDVTEIEYDALLDCGDYDIFLPESINLKEPFFVEDDPQEYTDGNLRLLLPSFTYITNEKFGAQGY